MKTVGAYEAKTHLSRLLDQVERGEEITITRHGVAVARLVPVGEERRERRDLVSKFREFRKGKRLDGITVRELIESGRR